MSRKELIKELKRLGITKVFNRPLSYCTKDELEYVFNQVREGRKPHLSFSQIALYQKCPRQFYYRYVRGLKIPPPGSVVVGKASHKAIEVDLKSALFSGRHEPLSVIEDVYNEIFKSEKENAIWEENPDEEFMLGLKALRKYAVEVLPRIEPEAVEEKFEVFLPSLNTNLVGIIDTVDTAEKVVLEHKTSRRSYQKEKISSAQLSIYSMVKKVPNTGINVLVRSSKPKIQKLRGTVREEDVYRTLADILHVANSIFTLNFPPAQQGTWVCSEKWCGYWEICRKDLEKQVKEFLPEEIKFLSGGVDYEYEKEDLA